MSAHAIIMILLSEVPAECSGCELTYVVTYHVLQPLLFLQAATHKQEEESKLRKQRYACELEVALSAVVQLEDRFILPQQGFVNAPQHSVLICPACTSINVCRLH